MANHLMNTYGRLPIQFALGSGAHLWDNNDKQYLDAISGIAVCSLGHAHPAVADAISEQAYTLVHTSNLYGIGKQGQLADELCKLTKMDRVFFSNSGAEANEAAIKLARLHGHHKGVKDPQIIVMENSFHGRTLATLSATGNYQIQAGFEPLVHGFVRVPYNDLQAIEKAAHLNHNIVGVLVEPVQGEGGVNIPDSNYLNGIRKLCDRHGWLMMLDEIQTGMGRTGKWFAHQHNGIKPDVMTLAKALGNGVPIGACLAAGEAATVLQPGTHGSTYGGNPLACAAGLAVIDTMKKNKLPQQAASLGKKLLDGLQKELTDLEAVKDLRGQGMMIGIELDRPCGQLVMRAAKQGLLINVTAGSVIRLLPPLILSDSQVKQLVKQVSQLVKDFLAE